MKVVLTHPIGRSRELECCDIGLGYLAAGLEQAGHEPQLWLRALTPDRFRALLEQERPGVVGLKVFSTSVQETIETIALIRDTLDCVVVVGGPHVTGDAGRVLDYIAADYAIHGEGDRAFPQLVSLLDAGVLEDTRGDVPGLVRREGERCIANPADVIQNVDDLPFPAWEQMPPGDYESLVCRRSPAASILTSRGCTNRCLFCAESNKELRQRSVGNVLDEIQYLVDRFGVREIQFLDSNFIARRDHIVELCQAVINRSMDLAFCAPNGTRLEAVDDEVCGLLARIGFYRVNVGVESGSQEVLRSAQKGADLRQVVEKIALFRRHKIQVVGNFMLGFPGETHEQLIQTLRLALDLDLTAANFSIYVPFPGTGLYDTLVQEGKLPAEPMFQDYDYVNYGNDLSELSPDELKRFRNKCVRRFLLRWRTIGMLYGLLRDGMDWRSILRRLYGMYLGKYLRGARHGSP